MNYRELKRTVEKLSLLGIGTMRLPIHTSDTNKIDEDTAINMIRTGLDAGVNYVDTAYTYHNGQSEVVVGKALQNGYREKVFLADKMPMWLIQSPQDLIKIFDEQLERLNVDHIDMYLIHNIEDSSWRKVKEFHVIEFLQKKKLEGKIKYIGFSFHGETVKLFKEVIDYFNWDFCQIQFNYMDTEIQAGIEGLKYAGSKDISVIIMEPLKGGKLADIVPTDVKMYWDKITKQRTPAEWALRYVANFSEVTTILSGISSMAQLKENIKTLSSAEPGCLTENELIIIDKVGKIYNDLIPYSCTNCKYCLPCPQKINIPLLINFRNEWTLYDCNPKTAEDYGKRIALNRSERAAACINCKQCEKKCPQHLPISLIMNECKDIFD